MTAIMSRVAEAPAGGWINSGNAILLEQIVEGLAGAVGACWLVPPPRWPGVPVSSTLDRRARRRTACTCCGRPSARRAPCRLADSGCTPTARWCRTTRTGCSCADRRRSVEHGIERADREARGGCRSARTRNTSCAAIRFGVFGPRCVLQRHARARAPAAGAAPPVPWARDCLRLVLIAALTVLAIVAHVQRRVERTRPVISDTDGCQFLSGTPRGAFPKSPAASACRDRASGRSSGSGCSARASRAASASPSAPAPAGSPHRPPS